MLKEMCLSLSHPVGLKQLMRCQTFRCILVTIPPSGLRTQRLKRGIELGILSLHPTQWAWNMMDECQLFFYHYKESLSHAVGLEQPRLFHPHSVFYNPFVTIPPSGLRTARSLKVCE